MRDDRWSEAIAVGSLAFIERVKNDLGVKAVHREVLQADGTYELRELAEAYGGKFTDKSEALKVGKHCLLDIALSDPTPKLWVKFVNHGVGSRDLPPVMAHNPASLPTVPQLFSSRLFNSRQQLLPNQRRINWRNEAT